jgi:hypothetical protein
MMLKRKSNHQSKRSAWTLLRAGVAGLGVALGGAAVTAGCLDRPVTKATPKLSNVYVDEIRQTAVDKIDLLFMIDNSISMADKQKILAQAVPILVKRLITPICVKACEGQNCSEAEIRDGVPTGADSLDGKCAGGGSPEFQPIKDIHVGIVTSSLGSHGGNPANEDVCTDPAGDDHAHLLGQIRNLPGTYQNAGFLKWDQTNPAKYTPAGDSDANAFSTKFTDMVTSADENGCGYEASLESWYRFLIDPEPPAAVVVDSATNLAGVQRINDVEQIDQAVLDQRAAFLREDSLVAVIMLSDENDCSIQDEGYGWLLSRQNAAMFKSTSECATDPNSECCQSCGEQEARGSCGLPKDDPSCAGGSTFDPNGIEDPLNLRCWDQKRRFGFDLLYPISRYSEGLTSPTIVKRDGSSVTNPLFATKPGSKNPPREKGLVFLAGIVGVPWQDIADEGSLQGDGLRYKTAANLDWNLILGNPGASPPVPPTDPFMLETPVERVVDGMPAPSNPITKDAIAPSSSSNPQANKINGHEQANVGNQDLQYACTFKLAEPLKCTPEKFTAEEGCDCYEDDLGFNRPLCERDAQGNPTTNQIYAKAYPGLRHLQALKEFGNNSIVASICPKYPEEMSNPDYGYNPAVKAIIDRLKDALKGKCLPRPLVPAEAAGKGLQANQVPCKVVEAVRPTGSACACNPATNRVDITNPALTNAILTKLKDNGTCDTDDPNGIKCSDFCTCELLQLQDQELKDCQTNPSPPDTPGYCYVNAAANEPNVGNPELVKQCSADSKRLLRFVGDTPAPGAIALVACLGASPIDD